MRVLVAIAGAAVLAWAAPPALAHGGQYKSPAAPDGSGSGGNPGVPTRGRAAGDWQDWWWANRDRYLEIARRAHAGTGGARTPNGGLGVSGGVDGGPAPAPEDPRAFYERLVLPAVTRALVDGEAEVRSAATIALGKMGFPRSLVDVEKALRDPHPDVRDGAILALGMIRDDIAAESLRGVLFDPSIRERTRGFAAVALGILGGEEGARILLRFLSPESDAEREGGLKRSTDLQACCVLALGHAGSPSAIPALRRMYAAPDVVANVPRACASLSLARLGDRESIPLFLKGLRHREAALRQCAALALGAIARPADGPALAALARAALEDDDGATRAFSIMALGRIGGAGGREALRPLLDGQRGTEDRPFVILALGIAGDRPSAPVIRRLFREEPHLRGSAVLALGLIGDREAAPEVREIAFGKGDAGLRSHGITALGLMGDSDSAPAMRRILAEEDAPGLRLAAAISLAILGDPDAVPAVTLLARHGGSVQVRCHSCYFLGILGGPAAAKALVQAVEDGKEQMVVRMHAVAGLGVLADRSPVPYLSGLNADTDYLLPIGPMQEVATFL
jgi:HEAT repeat protein